MREQDFLRKLKKEGKLKLVEPSENIKQAYLTKSFSYLNSAKLLLKHKKLEEAISLTYYSMYYSLLAILFKAGIKSENHTASIILMNKLFDLDNSSIEKAKKERIDKQYYVDFEVVEQDVKELIRDAERFNDKIFDFLENVNSEFIKKVRKKFELLVSWIILLIKRKI